MNRNGSISVILVIISVVLVGAATYFVFIKKPELPTQEQPSTQILTPTSTQGLNDNSLQPSSSATNPSSSIATTSVVVITTDKQTYSSSEKIVVTIHNNLSGDITTYNQRYDCSIIIVEKQSGIEWEEVRRCFSGAPSVNVTLKQGSVTKEQLRHIFRPLEAGIYRVSLIFSPGNSFSFGNSFTVSSAPFAIR